MTGQVKLRRGDAHSGSAWRATHRGREYRIERDYGAWKVWHEQPGIDHRRDPGELLTTCWNLVGVRAVIDAHGRGAPEGELFRLASELMGKGGTGRNAAGNVERRSTAL